MVRLILITKLESGEQRRIASGRTELNRMIDLLGLLLREGLDLGNKFGVESSATKAPKKQPSE